MKVRSAAAAIDSIAPGDIPKIYWVIAGQSAAEVLLTRSDPQATAAQECSRIREGASLLDEVAPFIRGRARLRKLISDRSLDLRC
jgi:hypothetical protein